ncbi:PRAME family member 8-like [Octodon degus]|uniref:PRAME family member 8-like n=1 Tax=Octodon degus TaxID=10160 RepID=A0A6P6DTD3_OCTDE|nr:PRAME family member 8-like [Octodon degus]
MQSPASLYELAKQNLMKGDTTTSGALHELPTVIFHDLFMDAFMREHNEVLKVMVQFWPFRYLPLRTLMQMRKQDTPHAQLGEITTEKRDLQTLEALLDGLDMQLSQNVHHSYSEIYAFYLLQLQNLQELHMNKVSFLRGNLHKIIRSQTPLEALSLCSSPLDESDLKHLSQCSSTSQLKALTLRRISIKSFNPRTLQVLLDKVSNTLETLILECCDITDTQILAILPALSHCSQLKAFNCYGNDISHGTLQALLYQTAGLSQFTQGLYPAPMESYQSNVLTEFVDSQRYAQVYAELTPVLQDIRPSPLNFDPTVAFGGHN